MRRPIRLAALVGGLSGCSAPTARNFQLPPELSDVDTIIVVREERVGFSVAAYPRAELPLPLTGSTDQISAIQLLGYRRPLADLFFEAGALEVAGPASCASGTLPVPDVGVRFELDSGEQVPSRSIPEGLQAVAFEQSCPCLTFEREAPQTIGPYGSALFVAALSSGGWLVATRWAILELDEALGLVSTATVWSAEDFLQDGFVARGSDGQERVLLVGLQGGAFEWTRARGVRTLPRPPGSEALTAITGAPDGSEIFVLDILGQVLSLDLSTEVWSELWTQVPTGMTDQADAIAWLGPGRVTISQRRADSLLELGFQGDAGFTKSPWMSGLDPTEVLHHVEGLGLILASGNLNVWLREDDDSSWRRLNQAGEGVRTSSFSSFDQGFLQVSRFSIAQYHERSGYCPAFALGVDEAGELDGDEERGWLIGGGEVGPVGRYDGQTQVVRVRRAMAD